MVRLDSSPARLRTIATALRTGTLARWSGRKGAPGRFPGARVVLPLGWKASDIRGGRSVRSGPSAITTAMGNPVTRREVLPGLTASASALLAAAAPETIETHVHLFDPERVPYAPDAPYKPAAYTLEDHVKLVEAAGLVRPAAQDLGHARQHGAGVPSGPFDIRKLPEVFWGGPWGSEASFP